MDSATTQPATKHLQSIGLVNAKRADAIKAGDVLIWNFGYTSTVLRVEEQSRCFLNVIVLASDGQKWTRKMKKDRLVGCTAASL